MPFDVSRDSNLVPTRRTLNGATMATRYAAVFYSDSDSLVAALAQELQAVVDQVDDQMSLWKSQSALCRLNREPPGHWIDLPRELMRVLAAALDIEHRSNGAFDIGVGMAVDAWGFGPSGTKLQLDRITLAQTGARPVTRQNLELDLPRLRACKHAALSLDLNGIAKGFAVDQMAAVMIRHGVGDWLVSLDGEIRAQGCKPQGHPWSVAVERPERGIRDLMGAVELRNAAIATSGDYRHWREHDGEILSHTMNPQTNAPLRNRLAAVSVMHDSCMMADAWATALMVLGPDHGPHAAAAARLSALFVTRENGGFQEIGVGHPWSRPVQAARPV